MTMPKIFLVFTESLNIDWLQNDQEEKQQGSDEFNQSLGVVDQKIISPHVPPPNAWSRESIG